MTFDPSIPQPTDDISVSQGELLTNFGQLNTQFGVNHYAFNDATNAGKHKFVSYVEQSDDPETKADEMAVYAKDDDGDTELYARNENNGDVFQLTKDGNIYTGLLPIVAVNFNNAGTVQGSDIGVSSITKPGSNARYVINFTAAVQTLLNGSNDYFWEISGFDSSSNPVVAQVTNNAAYGSVVTDSSLDISFYNQNGIISSITRASVIIWMYQ